MLLIISLILLLIVFISAQVRKFNLPIIIIALAVGVFFGSDVTNLIYFDNAQLTQKIANIALIFILFAGGYGTKRENLKPVLRPTLLLATFGVLLTAGITSVIFCYLTGWPFLYSLLLSSIISSTDAAAVFSILRSRTISNKKISSMTEIESAANDPAAIISTTMIMSLVVGTGLNPSLTILLFSWQLIGGIIFGFLIGTAGVFIFDKIRNIDISYYYVFLIGLILFSFSITDFFQASGILATFFTGYVLGNKKLPFKSGLSSFADTLSFIANLALFVLLGLLVFPKQFSEVWFLGIVIFSIISFISRPLAVFACTLFTKISLKERLFLSWSGIKGAVPIVLATYPAAAGLDPQHKIFNIVFFTVTLSILFQGTTIGKLADLFKFSMKPKKKAKQTMELVTIHDTNYELIELFIDNEIYSGKCKIAQLSLPKGTTITMVNRNDTVIAPSGATYIYPGDTLSVLTSREKIEEITLKILRNFNKI